jgi:hypothetical protein
MPGLTSGTVWAPFGRLTRPVYHFQHPHNHRHDVKLPSRASGSLRAPCCGDCPDIIHGLIDGINGLFLKVTMEII